MLDLCRIFHYAWFRWYDSAWFLPFQKVTSHGFHHDLRPGGRLPRKSITECFRAGPRDKSRSSSRKSAAGTVPTEIGSSAGHSFGKPQRDCVSETSLLSQLTRPRKLESRSVSTTHESLMTSKRDRGESVGQSMRDRENLHKNSGEREAESSILGENEAQKNYQRLKLMWKLEGGSKEVQKLLYMNPTENLKLKDYSFFRWIYGTMLKAKELVCVENWKWGTSSSKKVAQKIAKKLKNCEGIAVKRVTELDKQN